jgi:tetratricopeptide (TPR) repeat protein
MLRNRGYFRTWFTYAVYMLVFTATPERGAKAAGGRDADVQLEAAIHKEIVMGDLAGAMEIYRGILADGAAPRPVAAKALLQMGQCLEKLGQSEEAYAKYQRLVSEYSDQSTELTQARVRLAAWSSPRNLKFEEGIPGRMPPGWRVPALPEDSSRLAELRRQDCHSDVGCAVVMAAANIPRPEGTLMQKFSAAAYRGKTVRLRAWLRLDSLFVDGPTLRLPSPEDRAQLWLKVIRTNHRVGFSDNMDDRPVRATEWTRCEITGEIDEDAEFINFGVITIGGGKVWIDDVSFDVIGKAEAGPARSTVH